MLFSLFSYWPHEMHQYMQKTILFYPTVLAFGMVDPPSRLYIDPQSLLLVCIFKKIKERKYKERNNENRKTWIIRHGKA